jgi:predicted transport protein
MGSLFKLTYNVKFKELNTEKNFIDELRCRNGNLEITMSNQENSVADML